MKLIVFDAWEAVLIFAAILVAVFGAYRKGLRDACKIVTVWPDRVNINLNNGELIITGKAKEGSNGN